MTIKKYWFGLDIGGTKCAVILAKLDHGIEILDKERFATHTENGFSYAWNEIGRCIDIILDRNAVSLSEVNAIGVSCGGPLDSRKGMILCPPNLPGWTNIPFTDMLTEKYGIPAYIQNDANACALTEWQLGAGRGTHDMIFLTMGTGMGAGVIAEDRLIRGVTDMGGEIGHIRLTEKGPIGFGKEGSFEGWTSGGGIGRQARKMTEDLIAAGRTPEWIADGHSLDEIDTALMAAYARKGNRDAIALFDRVGSMLGRGLAMLVDAFNPERIIIGSVFARCEDLLRKSMDKALQEESIPYSLEKLKILPAETGERVGDLASIMVALYATGTDPMKAADVERTNVKAHFERLFERYPILSPCRDQIMEAYQMIKECYEGHHKLLLCGNGGSCADCEHIAGELMKGFLLKRPLSGDLKYRIAEESSDLELNPSNTLQTPLPAIVLTGHPALTTAFSNDCNPLLSMAQQVLGFGSEGDVLLCISTSGNAKNVLYAAATARAARIRTIGLTGNSGGLLKKKCDCTISVPAYSSADVQELHLPVYHTLCSMLEATFFAE